MFYYTEILLCLFALYCLFCAWPLKKQLFWAFRGHMQLNHAQIECLLRCECTPFCLRPHQLLFTGRHAECWVALVRIWKSGRSRKYGVIPPWPVLIYAFHPPCRCCRKSLINPWAFHFPAQLRVTEHRTNAKAVRREEERQTIDRKKDFTLWHGSNHCPQGNALQAEHAVNALKKKDKKSLPTLWNMPGEGSKLDLNKGCLTFKAGAADCCRVRWMRVTFQVA